MPRPLNFSKAGGWPTMAWWPRPSPSRPDRGGGPAPPACSAGRALGGQDLLQRRGRSRRELVAGVAVGVGDLGAVAGVAGRGGDDGLDRRVAAAGGGGPRP